MYYRLAHSLLFASLLVTNAIFAQSFHVSTAGDDLNPGTSEQPWRTIQKAANSATAGSTVFVHRGIYFEKVVVNVSGSELEGSIVFRPFENDTVIVDGSTTSGQNIFEIADKSYVKVIGFTIRNNFVAPDSILYGGSGIRVTGACGNIVLQHNTIYNMRGRGAMAITVYGTSALAPIQNILIDGNTIFDCEPAPSEALTLSGNVTNFQVIYNLVHNVNNIGIDFPGFFGVCPDSSLDYPRNGVCKWNSVFECRDSLAGGFAAGIYVDGASNIVVEGNRVAGNNIGISVGCEVPGYVTDSIRVESNFIWKNDRRGISIGGFEYPDSTGLVQNSSIRFNTLFANDQLGTSEGELLIDHTLNSTIEGNIFHSSSQNVLVLSNVDVTTHGVRLDYNLWFTPGGDSNAIFRMNGFAGHEYTSFEEYRSAVGMDQNSLFANPHFVSTAVNPDLHVLDSSPAINAGNPAFIAAADQNDIDEQPRVMGGRVDIGADETTVLSEARSPDISPVRPGLHQNFPNPFNPETRIRYDVGISDHGGHSFVSLKVFDILGQEVATVVNELRYAGSYESVFDGSHLPSGLYICRLLIGSFAETTKMLLLK